MLNEDFILYFDMDGVITDFDQGVIDLLGMTPRPINSNFDFRWYNKLYAKMKEVEHFYDKLKPIYKVVALVKELYDIYGDKIQILSAPPKPNRGIVTAEDDKINWTKREVSPDIKVNICPRTEKLNFCKGKYCIIVDDFDKTINEWNAAGGTGILFTNIEELRKILTDMKIL